MSMAEKNFERTFGFGHGSPAEMDDEIIQLNSFDSIVIKSKEAQRIRWASFTKSISFSVRRSLHCEESAWLGTLYCKQSTRAKWK